MKVFVAGLIAAAVAVPGSASAQVDRTPERPAPKQEGVEAVIPMNPSDPTYDIWKIRREDLSAGREPGPINVQRYYGGMYWQGIPTFFRAPIALLPEDLAAGDVDVAFISAHIDMGFGVRGASR